MNERPAPASRAGAGRSRATGRKTRLRARSHAAPASPEPAPAAAPPYDVFIAYADTDAPWVRGFAAFLTAHGVRVAYDELLAQPGGVRVHTPERAIRDAAHGLLVFGPGMRDDGWVRREYAALMRRFPENEAQRFVPVLIGDPGESLDLPEFAEVLYPADFRGADQAAYDRLCEQISRAVLTNRA
ncbi:toll/interleukin-1 receptor domain-containing protein [Streptomyces sp. NPDC004134]|uniref:toll/interleukin-1 receptor domain-containing protein n=1 Tax=Streptomyces sp. NPDC004134 TaxID=3364691 RepID=UPI003673AD7C